MSLTVQLALSSSWLRETWHRAPRVAARAPSDRDSGARLYSSLKPSRAFHGVPLSHTSSVHFADSTSDEKPLWAGWSQGGILYLKSEVLLARDCNINGHRRRPILDFDRLQSFAKIPLELFTSTLMYQNEVIFSIVRDSSSAGWGFARKYTLLSNLTMSATKYIRGARDVVEIHLSASTTLNSTKTPLPQLNQKKFSR